MFLYDCLLNVINEVYIYVVSNKVFDFRDCLNVLVYLVCFDSSGINKHKLINKYILKLEDSEYLTINLYIHKD